MILHSRMVELRRQTNYTNDLLQLDEAVQVMDRNDVKQFKEETENGIAAQKEFNNFRNDYKLGKQRIREREKKSSGSRRPRVVARRSLPDLSTIDHKDVKRWIPPNSYALKNNTTGEWIARLKGGASVSRSWGRYGEAEALRLVLRHIWAQHCDQEGLDYGDCPVGGLFEEPSAASSGGAMS